MTQNQEIKLIDTDPENEQQNFPWQILVLIGGVRKWLLFTEAISQEASDALLFDYYEPIARYLLKKYFFIENLDSVLEVWHSLNEK